MTAVQVLWINLAMDTMAALALATESPTLKLLDRLPYSKTESLISQTIIRNIIVQTLCHVIILLPIVYNGHRMFNIPIGSMLGVGHTPTVHYTLVFNVFVALQIFNELNSRRINNECNVMEHMATNTLFWGVLILSIVLQVLLVQFANTFFTTHPLTWQEHLFCICVGFLSIPLYQLARTVPTTWFRSFGGGKEVKFDTSSRDYLMRRNDLSNASLRSVTSAQFMNTPSTIPNLFSSIRRV